MCEMEGNASNGLGKENRCIEEREQMWSHVFKNWKSNVIVSEQESGISLSEAMSGAWQLSFSILQIGCVPTAVIHLCAAEAMGQPPVGLTS